MEETSPAFDLALQINDMRDELTRARVLILTTSLAKPDPIPDEVVKGITVGHQVWDIERIFRAVSSGLRREPIVIDFNEFGAPIPCLVAEDGAGVYTTYLAIMPGPLLGALYSRYGTRLLEKNIRCFLQARSKVNKGIRETILNEPNMFLTYNNGISATAETAELERSAGGATALVRLKDFQIVNGGQTTASLYHTQRKDNADLANVKIPMKLTILRDPAKAEEVVPRISRYANTQNPVNLADFAANDPFHRELEELSRTVWAPDPSGGKRQTHWFYERARGQYFDEKNRGGTRAAQRLFEAVNLRGQFFTKTDLAKYENTWNLYPYIVSRGAQKNFAEFSIMLRQRGGFKVDQAYFEDLVAKAILYKQAEKIISAQRFGGYRANIVTYTLAWISFLSQQRLDSARIWAQQDLTQALKGEIERLSQLVQKHIVSPPGGQNVTEWCKKADCWDQLKAVPTELSQELQAELVAVGPSAPKRDRGILGNDQEDRELITKVKAISASVWLEMSRWAKVTNSLKPYQRGILYSVGDALRKGREPSGKQARQALIAFEESVRRGFKPARAG